MDILALMTSKVKHIFSSDTLDAFAKETQFIQRKRTITAQDFLFQHLIIGSDKHYSLADMVEDFFERKQIKVSKQAIQKKYKPEAICFLEKVLTELMSYAVKSSTPLQTIPFVERVLTTDSSGLKLSQEFSSLYPGLRNQKAGLKLQTIMNVVTNTLYSLDICGARENDQSYTQYIEHIKPNDLSINDLGYFRVDSFKEIHNKQAFYLSRFLKSTSIYCPDKTPFDLESYLKKTNNMALDMPILLGTTQLPCRLVAIRLTPEAYEQRLKNLAEKKRKDGRKSKSKSSVFDEWTLFVTNLPESVSSDTLLKLYGLRWQIELFFKVIKTFLNLRDLSVHHNLHKALTTLYSSLIASVLLTLCSITIADEEISLYKAAKCLVRNIKTFIQLCLDDGAPILWFIEKIKRVAIKESYKKRPTAKNALGATYA